ncbi:MAG: helix-hairpin-helix domain-containing protein [Caldilineales bacterium]|nr:helix-hairpin-helix domain-containing protein [Caldilineales bacterium]
MARFASVSAAAAAVAAALQEKEQDLTEVRQRLAAAEARYAERGEWLEEFPAILEIRQWLKSLPAVKKAAADAALRRGAVPFRTPKPQKLSNVVGIGEVFEQRLYDAGIGTFWEVAHLSNEILQTELDITDWQVLNADLDGIRTDALRLAEETDTVGAIWQAAGQVDDLEAIEGLGPIYERRLYEAGLTRYEDIANATVEQLAEICKAPRTRTPDYAAWIEQAKALVAQKGAAA